MLVVGDREAAEGTVAVRSRTGGDLGARAVDAFIATRRPRSTARRRARARRAGSTAVRQSNSEFCRGGSYRFRPRPTTGRPRPDQRTHSGSGNPGHRRRRRSSSASCRRRRRWRSHAARDWTWWRSRRRPCRRSAGSWTSASTSTSSRSARAPAKKHQKVILVKEIKFRPKVDEHDYQFKKKHIERFLGDGDKVKATIFFRGRENAHPGNRAAHSGSAGRRARRDRR